MNLRHSYLHPLLNGFIILLLLWLAGLFVYVRDAEHFTMAQTNNNVPIDGLVVLTGSKERVPLGLDLLVAGVSERLLISGLGETPEDKPAIANKIVPPSHPAHEKLSCCITLGTYAEDTRGNAIETRAWAEKFNLKRLAIITSHYHMRRALIEMRGHAPHLLFVPYASVPSHVHLNGWWMWSGSASLLAEEYNKLLFAMLRSGIRALFRDKN